MERQGSGFTLIELSIVLVVIGLITGGILVGISLVNAAGERAQITQLERYNSAANAFYEKYMALPGDMNATAAGSFGFSPRGQYAGEGDGNGLIEGNYGNCLGCNNGHAVGGGETAMFWVDLSFARMIEGSFTLGSETTCAATTLTATSSPGIKDYYPAAKSSQGNTFITAQSNEYPRTSWNVFVIENWTNIVSGCLAGSAANTPGLTVKQAYDIDTKIDDGMPGSGNVYVAANSDGYYVTSGNAEAGTAATCFDNSITSSGTPGRGGGTQHYSLEINGGNGLNCILLIRITAGD